jgi:predicted lipoprotein with Yx(FWY)xxD motif
MKQLLSTRLLALAIAIGVATLLVAAAQASTSSRAHLHATDATLVALRTTSLGEILTDAHGRTLYLFEKDRNGVSMCNTACVRYWPALTSHGMPRAAKGVRQALLGLTRAGSGVRQVTYAGHPLYTFAGDKRPGQTSGENLSAFGADWYAVDASGRKVEQGESKRSGSGSSVGYSSFRGGW